MCAGQYADDPTIANKDPLWRRIHPMWVVRGPEGVRVTKAAFRNSPDGSFMSVTLGRECTSYQHALGHHRGYGLAALRAGVTRDCGQAICRDPQPDDAAHALVVGEKTKAVVKAFAAAAVILVEPDAAWDGGAPIGPGTGSPR
jgi:hypothetical protein